VSAVDSEILILLGQLQADMKEGIRQREALFDGLKNIEAGLSGHIMAFAVHIAQEEKSLADLRDRLVKVETPVQELNSLKLKGMGAIAAMAIIGAAAWDMAGGIAKKIIGGP
jgi:hypothetical protein